MTANKDKLQKLQLLQNTACRTLADKYENIKQMHLELVLYELADRRQYHLSTLCHKNIYATCNTGVSKLFVKLETQQVRRTRASNEHNIIVPDLKSNSGRKAIVYRGPQHWNKLPNHAKGCDKLISFQRIIESWIITLPNSLDPYTLYCAQRHVTSSILLKYSSVVDA